MRKILVLALTLWLPYQAVGSETDQYFTWSRRPIRDSTVALNKLVNQTIDQSLSYLDGQNLPCALAADLIHVALAAEALKLEYAASHLNEIDRLPATQDEKDEYEKKSFEGSLADPLNYGMPSAPSVHAAGVFFGIDKIQHFFSTGWRLHSVYLKALRRGANLEDAYKAALEYGVKTEHSYLGFVTTGVFSFGDLEADLQGVRFYSGLCWGGADGPRLKRDWNKRSWRLSKPFDWRTYLNPGFDESFNHSAYADRRWKYVRPMIEPLCSQLKTDKRVRMRRWFYRHWKGPAIASRPYLKALAAEGQNIPDVGPYTLDSVCGSKGL